MATGNKALSLNDVLKPDLLASNIADKYDEWQMLRQNWLAEKREVREYIFATDTRNTSAGQLDWKNSTHIPKLCQIRDNLQANYMAAMFPNDRPIRWEGDDESSEAKSKRMAIEAYLENKMRLGGFRTEIAKCVNDFIDYGNAFATVEFVNEQTTDALTGEMIPGFVGPKVVRISPLDIVFNPAAASFIETPKIVRSLKTIGTIESELASRPELGYLEEAVKRVKSNRHQFQGLSASDFEKNTAFQVDGFSSFMHYFQSDYVEVLDFYGDIYDPRTNKFYKNQVISVLDRSVILRQTTLPHWLGHAPIYHVGWRLRPDNLYAMGPLDNLIGMQYRIDHLENAKADAFDLIVHPVIKIRGFVEDFDYGPGERIYVADEGEVEFMAPDTTFLQADTQIALYEAKMEEMAGAPKQAMGFRTPGEKTAYEIQVLENGANRIFLNKTSYFEEEFLEKLVNAMLETARRNMQPSEVIRVIDDQIGVVEFMKITREDIVARGKIRPIGARHFARNANIIQNLTQLYSSPLGQDPGVMAHISGKKMAQLIEELLNLDRFELFEENVRIAESLETQRLASSAQNLVMEENMPEGGLPTDANQMVQPPQG